MSNRGPLLQLCSEDNVAGGLALALMLRDYIITDLEKVQMVLIALGMVKRGGEEADMNADFDYAEQIRRLTRHNTPNPPLRRELSDVDKFLEQCRQLNISLNPEDLLRDRSVTEVIDWLLAPLLGYNNASQVLDDAGEALAA